MTLLLFVAGFASLIAGGELLVRGATGIAFRLGVSSLMIGLTVVGFGTSTPELVTSVQAALSGAPGIAIGNVVGSNTANILLILGFAAILYPITVGRKGFLRDGAALAAASLALLAICLWGELGRFVGIILVLALVGYIFTVWLGERGRRDSGDDALIGPGGSLWTNGAFFAGGLALTILGARALVDAAITVARDFGISEATIGLTIVAVGTSLPELVTSFVAAIRKQGDIAFGNVVGSNIYNILGILGVTGLIAPIPIPGQIAAVDIWVMLGATALMFAVAITGWRITRPEGAGLLAIYVVYVGALLALT